MVVKKPWAGPWRLRNTVRASYKNLKLDKVYQTRTWLRDYYWESYESVIDYSYAQTHRGPDVHRIEIDG